MRVTLVLSVLLLLLSSTAAFGGANYQGRAWLSWNANWSVPEADLAVMPTGTQFLYVQLGELNELAGCEFELRWYPDDADCLDVGDGYKLLDELFCATGDTVGGNINLPVKCDSGGWIAVYGDSWAVNGDGNIIIQGYDSKN